MFRASKALGCLLILGCFATTASAGWDITTWRPWPFNKEEKPGKPDRVIASWTDTVMTKAGEPPVRGFGGRLMFYEGKNEKPVKIDGTLIVYAFDETGRDPNNVRPDRKFVFPAEVLPSFYSKSKIGHSYSVWLPWDEVGGVRKDITLIARFEPKAGPVVLSEQSRHLLPGVEPPQVAADGKPLPSAAAIEAALMAANPALKTVGANRAAGGGPATLGGLQPVSYETAAPSANLPEAAGDAQPRRMRTTTIEMPPEMAAPPGGCRRDRLAPGRQLAATGSLAAESLRNGRTIAGRTDPGQGDLAGAELGDTTRRLSTLSIPASNRTTHSANSRSCSVATVPRRIAVRPWISTWPGALQ